MTRHRRRFCCKNIIGIAPPTPTPLSPAKQHAHTHMWVRNSVCVCAAPPLPHTFLLGFHAHSPSICLGDGKQRKQFFCVEEQNLFTSLGFEAENFPEQLSPDFLSAKLPSTLSFKVPAFKSVRRWKFLIKTLFLFNKNFNWNKSWQRHKQTNKQQLKKKEYKKQFQQSFFFFKVEFEWVVKSSFVVVLWPKEEVNGIVKKIFEEEEELIGK